MKKAHLLRKAGRSDRYLSKNKIDKPLIKPHYCCVGNKYGNETIDVSCNERYPEQRPIKVIIETKNNNTPYYEHISERVVQLEYKNKKL